MPKIPDIGGGEGYRLELGPVKLDIYWTKVVSTDRRKSLLVYRKRRDGSVSRWEFRRPPTLYRAAFEIQAQQTTDISTNGDSRQEKAMTDIHEMPAVIDEAATNIETVDLVQWPNDQEILETKVEVVDFGLPLAVRCIRCGAPAYVEVEVYVQEKSKKLHFEMCAHHYNKHESALLECAVRIIDHRPFLQIQERAFKGQGTAEQQ